ncbi:MAG TPA: DUF4230 domain-containing protein [Bryobacteraceae bacterium]|nr:DUF4230 domain-containing protein [Bryobacteraceae bacterium]
MKNSRLLTAGFLIIAILAAYLLLRRPARPDPGAPAVLAQVQQLNELATVKYTIQKVVGLKEQKQPVGQESILLIVQASVRAGINLAGLSAQDIAILRDGTVEIGLPPARILGVAIDEKETRVWDRQKTWWAPWVPYSLDLEQKARLLGMESVKQGALDMGILAQAQRNAEISIRGLLSLAGIKSVRFVAAKAT